MSVVHDWKFFPSSYFNKTIANFSAVILE